MDREARIPTSTSHRTRNRWALGDLLESDERVPVRRFLRSHRPPPPRERIVHSRASSLADRHPRAPVFPIALASQFFESWSRILKIESKKKGAPGPAITAIDSIPRFVEKEKTWCTRSSRNRPESPGQPAGRC